MSNAINQNITIYLSNPYYKCLIDMVMKREKYKSRSDFISAMLKYIFVRKNLIDSNTEEPTRKALKRSKKLRELRKILRSLPIIQPSASPFEGLETTLKPEVTRKKVAPRV